MQPTRQMTDHSIFNLVVVRFPSNEFALLTGVPLSWPASNPSRCAAETALTGLLLEAFQRLPGARRDRACGSQWRIVKDRLGKPGVLLDTGRAFSVSYSYGDGAQWGVLTSGGVCVGFDVAAFTEFGPRYPFSRVFHDREWTLGLERADGHPAAAAALLWSCKEAAVKALGLGFHLIGPLALQVEPGTVGSDSILAEPFGSEPVRTASELRGPWEPFSMTVEGSAISPSARLELWTARRLGACFSLAVVRRGGLE